MIRTAIFPGRYVQGYDAVKRLGSECARFGEKGLFVCDPFVLDNLLPRFNDHIENNIEITVEKFGGECSEEEIERLADHARDESSEFVVGISASGSF